jgi:hypothetical protein
MTPGERVLVETALRITKLYWADEPRARDASTYNVELAELAEAGAGVLAEREGPPMVERNLTWGQVVEGDEIYSDKTGRWYPVLRSVRLDNGKMRINAKGLAKPIEPDPGKAVRVKRGETGAVVDMFASVLWSQQNGPEDRSSGPTFEEHDPATDPEASEEA